MHKVSIYITMLFSVLSVYSGQGQSIKGWHLKDLQKDSVYGISLDATYDFLKLKNRQSTPIIVAVIDSGIDTTHEDLKGILWHNPKEIPGNGIDDDGNGYIDDVYGWNFLGNKDGSNLKKTSDERTRIYHRYKNKFSGKSIDEDTLAKNDRMLYEIWAKAAKDMNASSDEQVELMFVEVTLKAIKKHDEVLRTEMQRQEFTCDELEKFQPNNKAGRQAKTNFLTCAKLLGFEGDEKNSFILSQLQEYIDTKKEAIESRENAPPDYREEVIKDDYFNINDRFYGNSDVMGPNPMHGTHVSGIIAAQRNNNLGVDGVADNVKIMMVRAIPDGDEYDKDVALAIKYAVDNGAQIINMSFGKAFSPEKKWVDEAIRYAESKDVLIVHAAGNESTDVDANENFPNADLQEFHKKASNFINVGASGDPHIADGRLIPDFSNYGKNNVDIFAPGVKIYSTFPGKSEYGFLKGTSMAAPVVTGIAAILRSYYPSLTAAQVKEVIEKSAYYCTDTSMLVIKPGTKDKVPVSSLCQTGGFVSAYKAVEIADGMKGEKKPLQAPAPQPATLPKATLKNLKVNN